MDTEIENVFVYNNFGLTIRVSRVLNLCFHYCCLFPPIVRISRERKGVVSMAENNRSRLLCGENWTQQSADVVCRQKGFPSALRSSVTYPVNKTECTCIRVVGCKGNERSLEYCDLTTLRGTDCVYAKVICKRGK